VNRSGEAEGIRPKNGRRWVGNFGNIAIEAAAGLQLIDCYLIYLLMIPMM
jgi:hypothetical protein